MRALLFEVCFNVEPKVNGENAYGMLRVPIKLKQKEKKNVSFRHFSFA